MRLTSIRLSPWGPKWRSVFADASPGLWEQRLHRRGQQLPVNSHPGIFLEALTANKSRREEAGELVRPTCRGRTPLCLLQKLSSSHLQGLDNLERSAVHSCLARGLGGCRTAKPISKIQGYLVLETQP